MIDETYLRYEISGPNNIGSTESDDFFLTKEQVNILHECVREIFHKYGDKKVRKLLFNIENIRRLMDRHNA